MSQQFASTRTGMGRANVIESEFDALPCLFQERNHHAIPSVHCGQDSAESHIRNSFRASL